jgi:hypothetical protein
VSAVSPYIDCAVIESEMLLPGNWVTDGFSRIPNSSKIPTIQ